MTSDLTPRLDPALRERFAALPVLIDAIVDPERARAFRDARFEALAAAAPRSTRLTHEDVRVPGGPEVRVYRPAVPDHGQLPAVLWMHGGGFSGGSARYEDLICGQLVESCGAVVVSVEYRLLPAHPYPAAVEDCYAALVWAATSGSLPIDPARIAVAGLSAGGTLAAATAIVARDRGVVVPAFQLILYASLDEELASPSAGEFRDPRSPNTDMARNIWSAYLADTTTPPPGSAVPMREADLAGLPPAYVLVGEVELVRDENIDYAQRLMAAGVHVELHVVPGAFHGFDVLVPEAPIAAAARERYLRALAAALGSAA